ncbi:MAG: hypothetical protein ABIO04_14235 [Ferruginibacter sp.]
MKISTKAELEVAIIELEKRKVREQALVVENFKMVRESLKPMNLIKHGFKQITEMPGLGEGLIKTAAGLGIGVISKKLFLGSSPSFIKKILSGFFELAVAKTTISNADKVKAYGISIYNNLFKRSNHKATDGDFQERSNKI